MAWINAAGSIIGSAIGANAAGDAADAQEKAARAATSYSQKQLDQLRKDQQPYRAAGYSALDRLNLLLGLNPSTNAAALQSDTSWQTPENFDPERYLRENPDVAAAGKDPLTHWIQAGQFEARNFPAKAGAGPTVATSGTAVDNSKDPMFGYLTRQFTGADLQNEPGYQFGLQQGTQATERSASAKGGLYSGATLKALQRYGQDYAGTKYNEAFNRDQINKDSIFNKLSGISGTGQTATNQVNAAGQNFGITAGNNAWGGANASAANSLAQGNILSNGINQSLALWQRNSNKNTGTSSYGGAVDPFNSYLYGSGGSGD